MIIIEGNKNELKPRDLKTVNSMSHRIGDQQKRTDGDKWKKIKIVDSPNSTCSIFGFHMDSKHRKMPKQGLC